MKPGISSLILIPVIAVLLLSSCRGRQENSGNVSTVARNAAAADAVTPNTAAPAFISFTDDEGVRIELDSPRKRIISLYSAHTENLFWLGAGGAVIGGHTTCTFPPEAAFLDMFDYSGDPEYIIAASPDLVLIRPFIRRHSPGYIRELERAGIPIVSLYTDNFDNFDDYIRRLASLAGLDAGPKLAAFHAELNAIRAKTAAIKAEDRQRIFFESTETEIRTAANGSFPALAIGFAGGVNIAGGAEPVSRGSSIAAFGMERVLEHADDIDVYAAQSGAMRQGGAAIPDRPGYSVIKAVRNGRVFVINEKLISSPTFRFLTGVKELARYMYPDLMDDFSELDRDAPATRASFAEIAVKALRLPVYVPSSSSYYRMPLRSHVYGLFADLPWTDSRFDAVETAVHAGLLTGETVNGREYIYPAAPFTGTGPERVPGGPDALDRPLTNGKIISAFAGNR